MLAMLKVLLRVTAYYEDGRSWMIFQREVELPVAYPGLTLYGFFGGADADSLDEIEDVGVDGPGGRLIADLKSHDNKGESREEILGPLAHEDVGYYADWTMTGEVSRGIRVPSPAVVQLTPGA